jgi:hypothetical protein
MISPCVYPTAPFTTRESAWITIDEKICIEALVHTRCGHGSYGNPDPRHAPLSQAAELGRLSLQGLTRELQVDGEAFVRDASAVLQSGTRPSDQEGGSGA